MRIHKLAFLPLLFFGAVPYGAVAVAAGTAAAPAAGARQATVHSATGAVLTVDAAAKTLTLRARRRDLTFAWDGATAVVGRKAATDLRAGSGVTVQYTMTAGIRKAVKITVNPPKRAAEQG